MPAMEAFVRAARFGSEDAQKLLRSNGYSSVTPIPRMQHGAYRQHQFNGYLFSTVLPISIKMVSVRGQSSHTTIESEPCTIAVADKV